jgi:hypothetical protein
VQADTASAKKFELSEHVFDFNVNTRSRGILVCFCA